MVYGIGRPNKLAPAVTSVRDLPGSNPRRDIDCSDGGLLCPAVPPRTFRNGTLKPWPLPRHFLEALVPLTLVDFQLDAQNSYLFIYNTLIKILHIFRALPCSSSRGLRRNCIYAASGIVTACRCREWRYQRLHIYNYDVDHLKMSRVMLEICGGF